MRSVGLRGHFWSFSRLNKPPITIYLNRFAKERNLLLCTVVNGVVVQLTLLFPTSAPPCSSGKADKQIKHTGGRKRIRFKIQFWIPFLIARQSTTRIAVAENM